MNGFFESLRTSWQLMRPYWFSDDKFRGRLLLAVIVGLALGQVYIAVLINQWNATFYNALQDKKLDVFLHQLVVFAGLATLHIAVSVYRQYFNQMLHMRWRTWMTEQYQSTWLANLAYYRLQVIYKNTDNPDQRIADDIDGFTSSSLSLAIGLLSSVVTLVSFVTILWGLSGPLDFSVAGFAIHIPAYMVWASLLYASIGSWLTHKIGRKLVDLNFNQQRFEANFRYGLVRVREHVEAIAFYRGEQVEQHTLRSRFHAIMDNWWAIMRKQKQLTWFTSGYGQLAIIFPFVMAAPRYFSGAIPLGGLMQTASAFGQVQGALSWFIDVYPSFASWKATTNRLQSFRQAMTDSASTQAQQHIHRSASADTSLNVKNLQLVLPNGAPLLADINFSLMQGERMLISGDSGHGKTTLLRALAGMWPYGSGDMMLPENANLLFIPQKPYLPLLPLRDIISYPNSAQQFSQAAMEDALRAVQMQAYIAQLDDKENWAQSLSLGEQQKLAFARILLHRPTILLMDEITASLDESAETNLYETLIAQLPETIIISVGHRQSLQQWHTQKILV